MGLSNSVDQMRESFDAQFEAAGEGRYLYRRNQKGEPIPVSADEHDRFIRQYVRRIWFVMAGMMAALVAFALVIIWRTVATDSELPQVLLYVGIGAIAVIAIAMIYWIRGAPARQLQGRTPVGRERTNEEMRAILLKKITYGNLGFVAVMGAVLPFTLLGRFDVLHGWGRLWLLSGAALILLAAVQAFRKWRFESDDPNDVAS